MIIENDFKRLYRAYFTNDNVWIVKYSGGWYCPELCSKIEAKYITNKCKGSKMYIYDPLNTENKLFKRLPVVFINAVAWNVSFFCLMYLSQLICSHLIFDDEQKAQNLTNWSFQYWLMALGVWHQIKGVYNYFKA